MRGCRSNCFIVLIAYLFNVSDENCVSFLEPLIESWDIDLANFGKGTTWEPLKQ